MADDLEAFRLAVYNTKSDGKPLLPNERLVVATGKYRGYHLSSAYICKVSATNIVPPEEVVRHAMLLWARANFEGHPVAPPEE